MDRRALSSYTFISECPTAIASLQKAGQIVARSRHPNRHCSVSVEC
ncbi:hypothetical protein [Myxacorys almedinensis]|uniref:Uncharacterized protein n=1 Tax=Myxacorys almedinensis A TaxID=2690445 RepID=A0A8J7ZCJ4_9CYAN|nr:hypothetical protein [Myxacorys almedinensis]NDJ19455.1 hypothetical protein [Myxacorys almedinensis A]